MGRKRTPRRASRSVCPVAGALDLLGDRWTLLVVRDAVLFHKELFSEFLEAPEKISSNTLTDRLQRLECAGVLERREYQQNPPRHRYVPTAKGNALLPLLRAAIVWGAKYAPGAHKPTAAQLAKLDDAIARLEP